MAPLLSTHSPTAPRGEGGGASHQRGNAFPTPTGRLYGFRRQRRYKNGARKGAHLASAAILYNSRGREPGARPGGVSRSRTEPLAPRAKGPAAPSTLTPVRACQPSGILESTALVPLPIPTAPQAPEPSFKNSARHLTASGQRLYLTSRISLRRLLFPLLLWFFLLS